MVDSGAYYFVACDGRRGDIIRCGTHQPRIGDPDNYFYYMWAETVQGFFLLRQHFVEGQAGPWSLLGEFEVEDPAPTFFETLSEHVRELLDSGELV